MKKPVTPTRALSRLQALCSRSEQCEADITVKLIRWEIGIADRKEIISSLKADRFIDEERFARSFAGDKARFSAWGPSKIRLELIRRKIPAPVINEALQSIDKEIWKEALMKSLRTKARTLDLEGEEAKENRQKLFRYMMNRGFPSAAVSKAISGIISKYKE